MSGAGPVPRIRTGAPLLVRWHRPLLVLAATMAALTAGLLVARFIDPRQVLGANAWDKPLKFAISTAIYSATWSWLIGQLARLRRTAGAVGTVMAIMLLVEVGIITAAAAAGFTSHFNVTTSFHAALWSIMATSISVLWLANLVVGVILWRNPLGERARTLAIRSGIVISLIGLALGFLMTVPTSAQLNDFQGIAGAHTVGIADGGPGLPVLGWSTAAGDLRIGHFLGMHALQVVPLVLILVELLSLRIAVLRAVAVRAGIIWVAASGYLAAVALVSWQALRGQSIVHPDALTLAVGGAIALAALAGLLAVVFTGQTAVGRSRPR